MAATAQIEDHVARPQPQGTHDFPLHGSVPPLFQIPGKMPPDVPGADDMLPTIHTSCSLHAAAPKKDLPCMPSPYILIENEIQFI